MKSKPKTRNHKL